MRPTKKQQHLLEFIAGFIRQNNFGPTYREIMRGLDYKSVSTVAKHIDELIARGKLVKRTRSARSLEVVQDQPEVTLLVKKTVSEEMRNVIKAEFDDENSTLDKRTLEWVLEQMRKHTYEPNELA